MYKRPTLQQLYEYARTDLGLSLGLALPVSFADILAKTLAGAAHGLHGHIEYLGRAMLPDSAETEILERWASVWGIFRKGASSAEGSVEFQGEEGSKIEAASLQGLAATYETTTIGIIVGGKAVVRVRASVPGRGSNLGAGAHMALISPVAGVQADVTAVAPGITGGADPESDGSLRGRLIQRIRFQPQGGAAHDYRAWAEEVPGVHRAFVYPLLQGPGSVGVTFVTAGPVIIPAEESELFHAVKAELKARAPVTAEVIVFAPKPNRVAFTLKITPDRPETRHAIEVELDDLLFREVTAGGAWSESGVLFMSQVHEAIGVAAGGARHTLIAPLSDLTAASGEVLIFGGVSWVS